MIHKFNIDFAWDFDKGHIEIIRNGEVRSRYLINNLNSDSILLDVVRRSMDDIDRAQLKLTYPEQYSIIFALSVGEYYRENMKPDEDFMKNFFKKGEKHAN